METKKAIPVVLICSLLFTALFHRQDLGLNLLIFEFIVLAYLLLTKQFILKGKNHWITFLGVVITAVSGVFNYSGLAFTVNFIACILFIGLMIYPEAKSLLSTFLISGNNLVYSQFAFLKKSGDSKLKGQNLRQYVWKTRIFIIPLFIILIFLLIYSIANPLFESGISKVLNYIGDLLEKVFEKLDIFVVFTFILGIMISNSILMRTGNDLLSAFDLKGKDLLIRKRIKEYRIFRLPALKNEMKAALFLLFILNVVILIVNVIDIYWVWFNFEWNGQYLKQFVHEGTYLLILSIFISISLVLYFFRNNLNFYKNNKSLILLSKIWIAQNAVLAISVGIRNFWYIWYYALAYKRIGVIVFLILTIYGLYTVYMKISSKRSTFYLFRTNASFLFAVMIFISLFNWDTIIAKYNFANSDRSFVHLNYLATLSDKSLPYLDQPLDKLLEIKNNQKHAYSERDIYMSPEVYADIIQRRKIHFKEKWESKNFLSWNYAEYCAYKDLK